MACLWCDEPSTGQLCEPCRAVNEGPVFHCHVHPVPTLGLSCFECDLEHERGERRVAKTRESVARLLKIRAQLVRDFHKPWPGAEHGKALVGMMIDGAIADLRGR